MKLASLSLKARNAVPAFAFLVCAVLLWQRAPSALTNPQFWAEDAVVFYDQAHKAGAGSLFLTHVGYFHEAPRIVSWLSHFFSALYAPAFFTWSTYFFALLCVWVLIHSRTAGSRYFGPLAALAFCLVPHLSHEVFWCLTNLQWIFASLLLLLLAMDPPEKASESWTWAGLVLLAGLTSPLSAVLLPVMAARLWLERKSRLAPALAAACATGLIQAGAIFVHGFGMHESKLPDLSLLPNLELLGRRVFLQGFVPEALWPILNAHCHLLALGFLTFFLGCLFAARKGRTAYVLVIGAMLLMVFACIARTDPGARHYLWDQDNGGFGDRYFLPIRFACVLGLILLIFHAPKPFKVAALVIACLMPLAGWKQFRAAPLPDKAWSKYAPEMDAGRPVEIPINPNWTYKYEPRPTR